jgi:hypothetical protein
MNPIRTKKVKLECLIDGVKVEYDMCCQEDRLDEVKRDWKNYKHIGSSHTYYINNFENKNEKLYHYFIKIK